MASSGIDMGHGHGHGEPVWFSLSFSLRERDQINQSRQKGERET